MFVDAYSKPETRELAVRVRLILGVAALGHDWVEVGVRELVDLDTLKKPDEGRRVRNVSRFGLAGTASEEAADTSGAVSNDRARTTTGGEDAGLVVIREDRPFRRRQFSAVAQVLPHVGEDAGSATKGQASGVVALYNHEAGFAVLIERVRVAQPVLLDETLKPQEAIHRIFEGRAVIGVRIHLYREIVWRNLNT